MDRSWKPTRRARAGLGATLCFLVVVLLTTTYGTAPAGASTGRGSVPDASAVPAAPAQVNTQIPIVFVHGYLGSGAQYRSPAMRFDSNGYPANRIRAFDYNQDASGLDAFIDSVRREFNVTQVHVAAHSLGTLVMLGYLLNPFQAAKVDKYVALDGVSPICVWGTQCTSISASSLGQTHIEASLSPESFARQYQFFTGVAPTTTRITRQTGTIQIAGRALNFQVNTPATGTAGQLWPVDAATGARVGGSPVATFSIGADGNFGPLNVTAGQPYEIQLSNSTGVMHFYYQPFIHSTYLLRLQVPEAGSGLVTNTNFGPNHAVAVVLRYREWWRASSHGAQRDNLNIGTAGSAGNQPSVNVLQNVTGDVAGVHVQDNGTPGTSSLGLISYFSGQAFQTGVDVYMPAAGGPNGTITFSNNPRGDASRVQVIRTPNWPSMVGSTRQAMLVEFDDYGGTQ